MPESIAAVGAFFAGGAAEAGAADLAIGAATADATASGLAAAGATAGEAAAAGTALGGSIAGSGATAAAAGVGAGVAGGSILGTLGNAAASAVATNVVGSVLAPKTKAPSAPAPIEMPDPLAQQQARQSSIVQQLARRGRAGSVLTDSGSGKLGG